MIKLTALYGHPTSKDDFEDHYARVHIPLARTIPNLERIETAMVQARPGGGTPPYYRVAELWFADRMTMDSAMISEQGKAVAADVAKFATGGATLLVADVDPT